MTINHSFNFKNIPTSIFSTYNASASGCLDTSTILPTRISNRFGEISVC